MRFSTLTQLIWLGLLGVGLVSALTALAAANSVSASRMAVITQAITANNLKPPECAALTLTRVVTGSGTIVGTTGNDLILGSSGADTIRGGGGTDCILGGGGDDDIRGNGGRDVCIGGPGTDTFRQCETAIQ
jgi:Ca2+-binding RTX toxin-like protein